MQIFFVVIISPIKKKDFQAHNSIIYLEKHIH